MKKTIFSTVFLIFFLLAIGVNAAVISPPVAPDQLIFVNAYPGETLTIEKCVSCPDPGRVWREEWGNMPYLDVGNAMDDPVLISVYASGNISNWVNFSQTSVEIKTKKESARIIITIKIPEKCKRGETGHEEIAVPVTQYYSDYKPITTCVETNQWYGNFTRIGSEGKWGTNIYFAPAPTQASDGMGLVVAKFIPLRIYVVDKPTDNLIIILIILILTCVSIPAIYIIYNKYFKSKET